MIRIFFRRSFTSCILLWCLSFLIVKFCVETSSDWNFTDTAESATSFSISWDFLLKECLFCLFVKWNILKYRSVSKRYILKWNILYNSFIWPFKYLFLFHQIAWHRLCKSHLRVRWFGPQPRRHFNHWFLKIAVY